MRPLDYGLSFICNPSPANSVRFWIESRTRITDPKRGTTTDYYQCASCKSEHTFAAKDLLHDDNYDFLPIFGGEDLLIFRRHARLTPTYRQLYKAVDVWGAPIFKPRESETVVVLDTWEKIAGATAAGVPIVTQTQIADEGTGLKATIECPTKTMNISIENRIYQVDTGPIALPDLRERHEPEIDCLRLAFIVFNAPHFADFVVEQPTPVVDENGGQLAEIYHFSNPISLPAKNRVLALGQW